MSANPRLHLVDTLVGWIAPQVMVFLGKIQNPITQKTERDLPSARALIDLLAELEEKTEGHLEEGERKLLQKTLTELRLNYLDEIGKPEPKNEEEAPGRVEQEEPGAERTDTGAQSAGQSAGPSGAQPEPAMSAARIREARREQRRAAEEAGAADH